MKRRATEPLREALLIQRAAARLGFDWNNSEELWAKLEEEIHELRAEANDKDRAEDELGDLLFMAVNLARHLGVNAPRALSRANRKFMHRFAYILHHANTLPPIGDPQRLVRMEELWQEAKRRENGRPIVPKLRAKVRRGLVK